MGLEQISAVVITRDAADTLPATLDSLARLPEVIVYDNGSGDDTGELARRYPNVRLVRGPFEGFGRTRNAAAAHASRDWILAIDADERADGALIASLEAADLDSPRTVYSALRENRLMGRPVHVAGWGRDWQKRLYHRGRVAFSDAPVHESLALGPGVGVARLEGRLIHDAIRDPGEFLRKVDRYSALRVGVQKPLHPVLIVPRAGWAFLRSYLLQLGFLAGWRGLLIAWSNANGVFFKYLRAWLRRREPGPDA